VGWVLLTHADATGRDVAEVGRLPYARTLWAHLRRREHEAMRSYVAKSDRLELASFNGLAFGNPAGLEEQRTLLRARIADLAGAEPVVLSREAALAAGEALRAQVAALDSQEE
jgi:hypothetical protein